MLYIRDIAATITIKDADGFKVEDRERRVLRRTDASLADARKSFRTRALDRAVNEYGIADPKVSVSGVKELLFDGSR